MSISLNILNHLGIQLYSNVAAVLSEVIANSWDADAGKVSITWDNDKNSITISDDGIGMNLQDINDKFLKVGYSKRADGFNITKKGRPVMGRKGIGKLSLFSIADTIRVESNKNSKKEGFILSAQAIRDLIKDEQNGSKLQSYEPEEIPQGQIVFNEKGTKITLTGLKKRVTKTTTGGLRTRIARRFNVIDKDFEVIVNKKPVTPLDKNYYHKVEYLWQCGLDKAQIVKFNKINPKDDIFELDGNFTYSSEIKDQEGLLVPVQVKGWIGTVSMSGDLKDIDANLNKISVYSRGKLAQEDILEEFNEGGIYASYLIGEIHADFLDDDNLEDISVSSRQEIIKDTPRYSSLKNWVQTQIKIIQKDWTNLRNKKGEKKALEVPVLKEWFDNLEKDEQVHARKLFGKINQLPIDNIEEKRSLFKHSVLAFENYRVKKNLTELDSISTSNFDVFVKIISKIDSVEATLYHQIIRQRVSVIKDFKEKIADNELEKVIQQELYKHLWLLDPAWDRATETPLMEENVHKAFKNVTKNLTAEEKKGRFDIKYKKTIGKHIIIELKRAKVAINSHDLAKQVQKYQTALRKLIKDNPKEKGQIEAICLVGTECSDWKSDPEARESREKAMAIDGIRVIMYQELIHDAYLTYNEFLKQDSRVNKLTDLLDKIGDSALL